MKTTIKNQKVSITLEGHGEKMTWVSPLSPEALRIIISVLDGVMEE